MQITSHTIVKDGMPYIGRVLEQVVPYMDRMLVTVSYKSTDGTLNEIMRLKEKYPKIEIDIEKTKSPAELTAIRQMQVNKTTSDWILFLDDDDFWQQEELEKCLEEIQNAGDDVHAFTVNPYHLLSYTHYDSSWWNKWFTKFFRNVNINYRGDWPRDMIWRGDEILYWKKNPRVKKLPHKFYHLANLKGHSFRSEDWADKFIYTHGKPAELETNFNTIYEG